jgi:type III pantothenate kinase
VLERAKLLLDIGNTSIKYAWFGEQHIADLQILRTSLESLPALLDKASHCFLCSVKTTQFNEQVKDICRDASVLLTQVETKPVEFEVKNAYANPHNMGTDRWMAIIAGAALCDKGSLNNYIVIDAGTAITCDFVVSNIHKGGWIAPGLEMARQAVVAGTSRVFDEQQRLDNLAIGTDTPDCVANGALAQLTGMLIQAIFIMREQCAKFEIYISGGDAPLLIQNLRLSEKSQGPVSINYLENLVLVGLAHVSLSR